MKMILQRTVLKVNPLLEFIYLDGLVCSTKANPSFSSFSVKKKTKHHINETYKKNVKKKINTRFAVSQKRKVNCSADRSSRQLCSDVSLVPSGV